MRIVFGIDVSKASSQVAIALETAQGCTIYEQFKITNNTKGFSELLGQLDSFKNPEIVFEATGVYSKRLNRFLTKQGYAFVQMNPLGPLSIK